MTIEQAIQRLEAVIREIGPLTVAVSGGVDSMTLAHVASRVLGRDLRVAHAVSPAVPPEATRRVERHAGAAGWDLILLDAGEQHDERYLANPVNRCFFCKTNLYAAIAATPACADGAAIASGTNTDDLGDFRPGLEAARRHRVRHPYVEAGIDKATVRAIARGLSLSDIAELPAAPCLASRIETGLRVTPDRLDLVHRLETLVRRRLAAETVRCRVRAAGLVVELDPVALAAVDEALRREAEAVAGRPVGFEAYRRGSAFLRAS